MKNKALLLLFFYVAVASCLLTVLTGIAVAEDKTASPLSSGMVENTDGDIKPNEYVNISPNGGITRRPCPYTCEMRGIPREFCKEWHGVDKSAKVPECYVHDLRIPSGAIKFGK